MITRKYAHILEIQFQFFGSHTNGVYLHNESDIIQNGTVRKEHSKTRKFCPKIANYAYNDDKTHI